ncbi:MAG TPA: helix-turn-helix domain-containing protein [Pseudomonadota bacterium]|nr:helix-turn-helix domain-containing protein [Pseudomonadota bacterium]
MRSDALAILANDLGASGPALAAGSPPEGRAPLDAASPSAGARVGELLASGAPRPSAVQIFAAYDQAVERSGDPWLGLRLGAARGPEWLGPLGIALGNMPTLRACIELAQRLIGMLVDGQRLELHGDLLRRRLVTTLPAGLPPAGALVVLQSSVVLMANLFDAYVRPGLWPLSLCFACPPPPVDHPSRAELKRPGRHLQFGADHFGLEFPASYLDLVPHAASASPEHQRLVAELEAEQQRLEASRKIEDRLQCRLLSVLALRPQLGEVARSLGMSPRSLQQHLAAQGQSFQSELARLRLHVARQYLTRTRVSLATIAVHLGFQNPETFSRFFQRAMGESPRRYRQRSCAPRS